MKFSVIILKLTSKEQKRTSENAELYVD